MVLVLRPGQSLPARCRCLEKFLLVQGFMTTWKTLSCSPAPVFGALGSQIGTMAKPLLVTNLNEVDCCINSIGDPFWRLPEVNHFGIFVSYMP